MSLYELYLDIDKHLLNDEVPSEYFNQIYSNPSFKEPPFDMIYNLRKTNQSKKFHPEGNVWNHTMMVVDEAAKHKHKSKNACVFMWAALLHDIGKPSTTKSHNGKITSYEHDKVGAKLAIKFLDVFTDDREFIKAVSSLIRWHMQILFVVNGLPYGDIDSMMKDTDIEEVALLGLCDRLGRLNADRIAEQSNIDIFINKTKH